MLSQLKYYTIRMVMTILEAKVDQMYWRVLEEAYENITKEIPPVIKKTYLAQDQKSNSTWRILTIWESQEALNEMRRSGITPTGVAIFQQAKAKPSLTIYDVKKVR